MWKTHLSVALGMRTIMSDIPVYYTSAMKLVQTLRRDYDMKRLEYRIKTYSRFRLEDRKKNSLPTMTKE